MRLAKTIKNEERLSHVEIAQSPTSVRLCEEPVLSLSVL